MGEAMSGHCLCGAVSFTFEADEQHVDACHCGMCRRWGGGPSMSIKAAGQPSVTGGDNVVTYASSEWATRSFCGRCGTHLFYAAPAFGYHGVSAGSIADAPTLTLTTEIFIDRKPDFYAFANATQKLTEAEFTAMISAPPATEQSDG